MKKVPLSDSELSIPTLSTRTSAPGDPLERIRKARSFLQPHAPEGKGPRILYKPHGTSDTECMTLSGTLVIGRSSKHSNLNVLDDEMSRRHFQITPFHGNWAVHDLDSKNYLYVNGHKVTRHLLVQGDVIQAGDTCFLFMVD